MVDDDTQLLCLNGICSSSSGFRKKLSIAIVYHEPCRVCQVIQGKRANTSFTPAPAPYPLPALEKSRRTSCRSSPTTRTAGGTPTDACLSKPSSLLCALWCAVRCGCGARWRGSRPCVPRCAGALRPSTNRSAGGAGGRRPHSASTRRPPPP